MSCLPYLPYLYVSSRAFHAVQAFINIKFIKCLTQLPIQGKRLHLSHCLVDFPINAQLILWHLKGNMLLARRVLLPLKTKQVGWAYHSFAWCEWYSTLLSLYFLLKTHGLRVGPPAHAIVEHIQGVGVKVIIYCSVMSNWEVLHVQMIQGIVVKRPWLLGHVRKWGSIFICEDVWIWNILLAL